MATEPPPCLTRKYFQKTRRGKVLRVVRERYLRDDIGFGTICTSGVTRLTTKELFLRSLSDEHREVDGKPLVIIVDTNIVLRQLDALESTCAAVQNIVLCETVISEAKKRNASCKTRLIALMRDTNRSIIAFPNENHRETFDIK